MRRNRFLLLLAAFFIVAVAIGQITIPDERFITYVTDPNKNDIQFYWKDDKQELFRSIENLQQWLEKNNRTLVFATNGGMYKTDNSPLGLFIQNQNIISRINSGNGGGNFYMKPNGVFYITSDNTAKVCVTEDFNVKEKIKYATQSGPMLVVNGKIHSAFKEGSTNINIRSGVGILKNGKIVFAMSKEEINFYDFAKYFLDMGCSDALYLDGFVSRTYLPSQNWKQTDGNFGVIIGVTVKK